MMNSRLEGERVILLPLEMSHINELYEAAKAPEIWSYSSKSISSIEDMKELIVEALMNKENGFEFPYVIYDKTLNRLIGSTRYLNISKPHRNLEIGWTWLTPEVWRSRVNTEAKYLLLKYAFEEFNAVRVQFKADVRNQRSNRAIERIGASLEGRLRKDRILSTGHIRDAFIYSITFEEWDLIKQRLESLLIN